MATVLPVRTLLGSVPTRFSAWATAFGREKRTTVAPVRTRTRARREPRRLAVLCTICPRENTVRSSLTGQIVHRSCATKAQLACHRQAHGFTPSTSPRALIWSAFLVFSLDADCFVGMISWHGYSMWVVLFLSTDHPRTLLP